MLMLHAQNLIWANNKGAELMKCSSLLELKEGLIQYCDKLNTGFNFGDPISNCISLENWILRTRSLYLLYKLGASECGSELNEELQRATRRLDLIDFTQTIEIINIALQEYGQLFLCLIRKKGCSFGWQCKKEKFR